MELPRHEGYFLNKSKMNVVVHSLYRAAVPSSTVVYINSHLAWSSAPNTSSVPRTADFTLTMIDAVVNVMTAVFEHGVLAPRQYFATSRVHSYGPMELWPWRHASTSPPRRYIVMALWSYGLGAAPVLRHFAGM